MATNPVPEVIEQTFEEQFLDLLCSDAELLRAEFDSIIAAEWPDPPSPVSRRQPSSREPSPCHGMWSSRPLTHRMQERPLGREAWRRQRSPPSHWQPLDK